MMSRIAARIEHFRPGSADHSNAPTWTPPQHASRSAAHDQVLEEPALRNVLASLLDRKVSRFAVCGVITAGFNLALLAAVIEGFRIETGFGRSLANLACTEVAVLFSFFVYKIFVWRDVRWGARDLLLRQLPIYHGSVATSFLVRTLIAFPLLDAAGVHYTLNLLIGIGLGAVVNFLISDRFVFRGARAVVVPVQEHSAATLSARRRAGRER